jgi:hypothetical protein
MLVLAIVNVVLLLVGFLPGLRRKSPVANPGMAGDSAASRAYIE